MHSFSPPDLLVFSKFIIICVVPNVMDDVVISDNEGGVKLPLGSGINVWFHFYAFEATVYCSNEVHKYVAVT